jgi:DNA uptake protein ComE-like DNA-binding protein
VSCREYAAEMPFHSAISKSANKKILMMPNRSTSIISFCLMKTERLRPFLSWHKQHQQERKGTIVLLIIVLALYMVKFCITHQTKVIIENAQTSNAMQTQEAFKPQHARENHGNTFSPSESSEEVWQRAGLSEKKAKSVLKYLQQGGRINSAGDLDKINCLNDGERKMLREQLHFPADTMKGRTKVRESLMRQPAIVELNSADTAQLMTLPGIGKWFARKIIERRDQLGGFYDEQQLLEVYRMTQGKIDSLYDYVRIHSQNIRRIRINHVHPDTLAMHPYIRRKLAHTICSYRDKHGRYRDIEALKRAVILDSMQLQKLSYYLSFD